MFPYDDDTKLWFDRIIEAERELRFSPFALACKVFAEVILSHPLGDGNGRLARALFSGSLARGAGLACPILPLGPVCYANRPRLVEGLRSLAISGDWYPFVDLMGDLTYQSLQLTRV